MKHVQVIIFTDNLILRIESQVFLNNRYFKYSQDLADAEMKCHL